MENQSLSEIRGRLAMLPVLQQRMKDLDSTFLEAQNKLHDLMQKYNKELIDVENMKKDSLSNTVLRLINKYEDKLDKETKEMLSAKLEHDKAAARVEDLRKKIGELQNRIQLLLDSKEAFESELRKREDAIRSSITSKAYAAYRKLEEQREKLLRQLVEIDEAVRAARQVEASLRSAIEHLDSAESWATFDIWTRGGIFSHMAKYDHIDSAQADFDRLSHQLQDLSKELADIKSFETLHSIGIDSTTRMFDFWWVYWDSNPGPAD